MARPCQLAQLAFTLGMTLGWGCLAGPRHLRHATSVTDPNGTPATATSSSTLPEVALTPTDLAPFADATASVAASTSASSGPEAVDDPSTLGAGPDPSIDANNPDAPLVYEGGTAPAIAYGELKGDACVARLKQRKISFVEVTTPVAGVDRPLRLTGPLHGVSFHSPGTPAQLAKSQYEIVDCRLVLALDDLSKILAAHDVVEGLHMSMYRPPPKNAKSKKARSQHEAALAIDLGTLVKSDGTKLSVLDDFHGAIGAKTCGKGSGPWPATKKGKELREILCAAYDARLFNVMLTPNYNKPHQNHFHLEVTRGVKWFLLH